MVANIYAIFKTLRVTCKWDSTWISPVIQKWKWLMASTKCTGKTRDKTSSNRCQCVGRCMWEVFILSDNLPEKSLKHILNQMENPWRGGMCLKLAVSLTVLFCQKRSHCNTCKHNNTLRRARHRVFCTRSMHLANLINLQNSYSEKVKPSKFASPIYISIYDLRQSSAIFLKN